MAKVPKVKKKGVSVHSRAARRGVVPAPKEEIKPAKEEATEYSPWLHNAHNAGISKKKKTKQLTRQQKQRQAKGLEHGERNSARLEKKIEDSKKRSKKVQERAKQWEELNEEVKATEGKKIEAVGGVVVDEVAAKAVEEEGMRREVDEVDMADVKQPVAKLGLDVVLDEVIGQQTVVPEPEEKGQTDVQVEAIDEIA